MKKAKLFRPNLGGLGSHSKKFNGRKEIDDLYDSNWSTYSKVFLTVNPLCYSCGSPSQVTDHLEPHKGDSFLFKKTDNHIPLCHKCHNTITAKFDRNYIKKEGITKKLKWIADNRFRNGLGFPVKVLPKYGK